MIDLKTTIMRRLFDAFPGSYINDRIEFIAIKKTNLYFILWNCLTPTDVKCKILEWFSRDATKAMPFRSGEKNRMYQEKVRTGINHALQTDFSQADLEYIYTYLGNAIRHDTTIRFVENGYDMEWLKMEIEIG